MINQFLTGKIEQMIGRGSAKQAGAFEPCDSRLQEYRRARAIELTLVSRRGRYRRLTTAPRKNAGPTQEHWLAEAVSGRTHR